MSAAPETTPKYTYTPFPQSTTVHPLRPYYNPTDAQHFYTPSLGNASNNNLDDKTQKHGQIDVDSENAVKTFASFAILKFFSSAFSEPFDVAKTLLQVQYLPNEDVVSLPPEIVPESEEELTDDDEFYSGHQGSTQPLVPESRSRSSDNQGYLVNTNVYDEATRPLYMLPPLEKGVWNTMQLLTKHKTEGFFSLWKGQLTNWIYEMSHLFVQSTIEGVLNDAFDLYDDTIPLVYLDRVGPNIATLVASHVFAGVILSPLELVKTRLIVQTASPLYKKYNGTFNCLRTIVAEEGFTSLYWSHNLLPSIVYHAISPLMECTIPLIIDRIFHISSADSPVLYGFVRLGLYTLKLLITLPLETVRKRLQCQIRSRTPGKRFETIVQTRQAPYLGIPDCIYRIILEEGISQQYVPNQKRRRQRSWFDNYGIGSLYAGFEMHFLSSFTLFLFTAVNGVEDDFEDF
ncbi:6383_t:CDS:2 [Ambispora gerdemannii]|uniref:6383_t:CDS:1 n=1 Tax=Ambispora gerdemannii TaxID=144530 RepID=A0A9N8YNV1_9GLOM|nr:6383_t:CDS:2 [Ambispora gerdemannii]